MTKIYTDQLGNQHTFEAIPKRIVSLVPSQTELLYDLGLEDSIVGITKFCVHPIHFKKTKKIIGGTKNANFIKIEVLRPDIIIANKEENTKAIVDQLSQICPVIVTDIKSVEDNIQLIEDLGKLFDKEEEAKQWITKISLAHLDFQFFMVDKPIKKVLYFIWAKPYMVAGKDTFIDAMLKLNGFQNACNETRYPEIQLNELNLWNVNLILLSSEPYPFNQSDEIEIGKFASNVQFLQVDGECFSWYGTRLLKAFEYFKTIHQNL